MAGFSTPRVWLFHLLPSLRPILVAQCTVAFGFALLDLAAISFIGLGVQPPQAEWGLMVSQGRFRASSTATPRRRCGPAWRSW